MSLSDSESVTNFTYNETTCELVITSATGLIEAVVWLNSRIAQVAGIADRPVGFRLWAEHVPLIAKNLVVVFQEDCNVLSEKSWRSFYFLVPYITQLTMWGHQLTLLYQTLPVGAQELVFTRLQEFFIDTNEKGDFVSGVNVCRFPSLEIFGFVDETLPLGCKRCGLAADFSTGVPAPYKGCTHGDYNQFYSTASFMFWNWKKVCPELKTFAGPTTMTRLVGSFPAKLSSVETVIVSSFSRREYDSFTPEQWSTLCQRLATGCLRIKRLRVSRSYFSDPFYSYVFKLRAESYIISEAHYVNPEEPALSSDYVGFDRSHWRRVTDISVLERVYFDIATACHLSVGIMIQEARLVKTILQEKRSPHSDRPYLVYTGPHCSNELCMTFPLSNKLSNRKAHHRMALAILRDLSVPVSAFRIKTVPFAKSYAEFLREFVSIEQVGALAAAKAGLTNPYCDRAFDLAIGQRQIPIEATFGVQQFHMGSANTGADASNLSFIPESPIVSDSE